MIESLAETMRNLLDAGNPDDVVAVILWEITAGQIRQVVTDAYGWMDDFDSAGNA